MNIENQPRCRANAETAHGKLAMLALCAIALVAAIARQQTAVGAETKTATLSVADLDLATAEGIQAAHERLHQAARQLCSRVVDPWSLSHQPEYVACVDDAMAGALQQLKGPVLVANARLHERGHSAR